MATIPINSIDLVCEMTHPVEVQYINGNLFSFDHGGNAVHVYVKYAGEPVEIAGSVSASVIRADGTTVAVPGAVSGSMAYVILPQSCYAVPGVVSVVVKVTEDTTVTTIAAFVANVYRSSTDTIVDPGTIIPSVQNLISAIETAVASIPADYSSLWESLAPDYTDITFPVTAGKYCTYNGTLYIAKVDIATTESFTAAHWQSTNIGDNLSALKSALSEEIDAASVTSGISGTPAGLTIAEVSGDLKIYGTVTQVRRICFLNGQSGSKTTGSDFSKTLDAGTYEIQADCTGAQTAFRIDGTYSTFSNAFVVCSSDNKNVTITFTAPVMIGFYTVVDRSYGTSESPSLFSISIKRITAKDIVARGNIVDLETYNTIHAPGYQNTFAGILLGFPTFVHNSDKSITVTIPANGHGRAFWTGDIAYDAEGSESRTFNVPKNYYFVYDTVEKDYAAKARSSALSTDIICFWNTASGEMVGPWLSYLAIQKAEENKHMDSDDVPDYYYESDYLPGKISDIQEIGSELGIQSARFVFITDYHIGKNSGKSPALAKKIMRETGIKELFFNGDYNDKELTSLAGYKVLCDFMDAVKPLESGNNIHYTTGNHEYNNPSATEPTIQLDRTPIFQLFNAYDREIVSVNPEVSNAYYVDYEAIKIRIYGIDCDYDSGISAGTRKFVFDSLLNVPEDYAVIITSHVGKSGSSAEDVTAKFAQIMECCAAMNDGTSASFNLGSPYGTVTYDFTGRARTFVGALTGHTHMDGYVIYDGRFPVIITECDALDSTRHPERTDGTITEQAFEVVQIDVDTKRIYLTRIGNGDDRTFSFG